MMIFVSCVHGDECNYLLKSAKLLHQAKSLVGGELRVKVDNQDVLTPLLNKMLECGSSSERGVAPWLLTGSLPDLLYNGLKIAPSHVVSM